MADAVQALLDAGAVPLADVRDESWFREAAKGLPLWARSGNTGIRAWTMIDADDYWLVSQRRWHYVAAGYVACREYLPDGTRATLRYLHRELMGLGPTGPRGAGCLVVDHVNRHPLDNRRCNLRIVTDAQNQQNRRSSRRGGSRFRGVTRDRNKWRASARLDGVSHRIGVFDTEQEAAEAAASWRAANMPYATD